MVSSALTTTVSVLVTMYNTDETAEKGHHFHSNVKFGDGLISSDRIIVSAKSTSESSSDSKSLLLQNDVWTAHRLFTKKRVIVVVLAAFICIAVAVSFYFVLKKNVEVSNELDPPDVTSPLPPSKSILGNFSSAAVVSNGGPCAGFGKQMLAKNGSAVDAAIATLLCDGVTCLQNMGIGGGFLMTIYIKKTGEVVTLNARETAPAAATEDMYEGNSNWSQFGALAAGIPGELRGYYEAWKKYGKLQWNELFEPTIKLCEEGVPVNEHLATNLAALEDEIRNSKTLSDILLYENNTLPRLGDFIKLPTLAKTLRTVAYSKIGADELYNGTLTKQFVQDIQDAGGIITEEDMANYEVEWGKPIVAKLSGDLTLYSVPPPGSGILVAFIIRVLDGFVQEANSSVQITQRITEAFKHAYGHRTDIGDPRFTNITEILNKLQSEEFIMKTRSKILDTSTSQDPAYYGADYSVPEDHGTANIVVLAPNGDAVAVTSTVNLLFGSQFVSPSTGIILNDEMDDFSSPRFINYFGVPPSPANYIRPGKRPMSSMCPTIIVDKNGDVRLAVGSAGGTKITTSTALVTMNNLWFGMNIKQAVDHSRFHHQLLPMQFSYEYGTVKTTVDGMRKIGHVVHRLPKAWSSCVTAIARNGTGVTCNSDFRRPGSVQGL